MNMKIFLSVIFLFSFCFSITPAIKAVDKSQQSVIRVTPPPPKFSDAERQSELARRRSEVFKRMQPDSIFIMWSAESRNYSGTTTFMYRQENNLYYLANLRQGGATLVLVKNGEQAQEFLFLPRRDPSRETWDGRMYSRDDAMRISGLKTIFDASELQSFLQAFKDKKDFVSKEGVNIAAKAQTAYFLLPNGEKDGAGNAEFRRENEFVKTLEGYKIVNARPIFTELRHIKSPMEIKLLQHAIDITTEAQMRAMATVGRVKWEYETQAEVEYIFRKRNANYWGYQSIVGCGPNATTLHYRESQGGVRAGELLLMDVGAEYDHYTADVTRTFPVNGRFTKEQAEIYQIVFDAQEAAARATKPGATFKQISDAADAVIKQGLARLGLITAPDAVYQVMFNGQTQSVPQYRIWYMHSLGHWLGMNVHDVGNYAAPFKPGMVFTNEPGIYIREDALDYLAKTPENEAFIARVRPAFEKYKNIGVRIEDDMLVTKTGVEWMSKALPRTIKDIEAFMAKASKEVPFTALNNRNLPRNLAWFGRDGNFFLPEAGSNFTLNQQGVTNKRGWVRTGKQIAAFGSSHDGHSHGE